MRQSAALLCFFLFIPLACKKESDEDRIKAVIRSAIDAGNQKKAAEILQHVTADFQGPRGADAAESRRLLLGLFLQNQWLHTFERGSSVTVDGDVAKAEVDLAIARGNPVARLEDVPAANLDLLVFDLDLVRVDGAWKIKRAAYRYRTS
jgi:hypothetical protein